MVHGIACGKRVRAPPNSNAFHWGSFPGKKMEEVVVSHVCCSVSHGKEGVGIKYTLNVYYLHVYVLHIQSWWRQMQKCSNKPEKNNVSTIYSFSKARGAIRTNLPQKTVQMCNASYEWETIKCLPGLHLVVYSQRRESEERCLLAPTEMQLPQFAKFLRLTSLSYQQRLDRA